MNIDILICKYYLIVNEIEEREEREKPKGFMRFDKNISVFLFITSFVSTVWSIFSYIVGVGFKNHWAVLLCIILIFILLVICAYASRKDEVIRSDVIARERYHNARTKALMELLYEHNLSIDKATIDVLTEEAENNKAKYTYFNKLRKVHKNKGDLMPSKTSVVKEFIGLLTAVATLNVAIIGLITKNEVMLNFLTDVGVHITENIVNNSDTMQLITQIALIAIEVAILIYVLIYVYSVLIDPHIRKMYFFHDTFIYDLKQLLYFRAYYEKQSNHTKAVELNSDLKTPK